MTRFDSLSDLTYDLRERIVAALGQVVWSDEITVQATSSSQSPSQYIEVGFFRGDDCSDDFVIRISDHEARSYNRTGHFNISVGQCDADTHVVLAATIIEDDDGDYLATEADEADVDHIVAESVAAVRRFHARAEFA